MVKCENCKFWIRNEYPHGRCHFYAPVSVVGIEDKWPQTVALDQCGDGRDKEPLPVTVHP